MQDMKIYVTGIKMLSAFNTVQRDQLSDRAKEISNEDKIRILRMLLDETALEVKVENAQATTFESNIDSSSGNIISGLLFIIYFNNALQTRLTLLKNKNLLATGDKTENTTIKRNETEEDWRNVIKLGSNLVTKKI